jgi:RNAse (barnase) inhibitor barstar
MGRIGAKQRHQENGVYPQTRRTGNNAIKKPSVDTGRFEGKMSLYAHCADALTKQQVCGRIGENFHFPKPCSKNFDALKECLTNTINAAGPQPGFIVVLEQLPNTQKFDKEARETLLDVFRDAADYWAEKKVPFRVFYSFE